jgi:hypothetical protein
MTSPRMNVEHSILRYGAVPSAAVNSAAAIQRAVDAVRAAGGGTVIVPAGLSFMCGSFALQSNVRLHLEPGSVLLASPNIADYTSYEHEPAFARSDFCRFWILTRDAENVTIDGEGTLDANSPAFVAERRVENTVARNPRAQSVVFLNCRDVLVHDIRIVNAPSWALRPANCERVLIEGVTIRNDLGLVNSDGIDVDCSRDVRIANCHIEAGDDAISIKGRQEIAPHAGPCEDIVITGCVLESHGCALRLGLESFVDFRRIVFANSIIRRSHRGIAIDCRDPGVVEDLLFSDIAIETVHSHPVWWHESEPIWICQVPYPAGRVGGGGHVAALRRVVFRNLLISSEQGVYVQGAPGEAPPTDILFDNVSVHIETKTGHPRGFFDPRPHLPGFAPAGSRGAETTGDKGSLFRHDLPGFFIEHARDLVLRHCRVSWGAGIGEPYSHAVEAWNTQGLRLEGFQGAAARPGLDAIAGNAT